MEMENKTSEIVEQPEEQKTAYAVRPLWRMIGAWIGLILFLGVVAGFYILLAKGGL